MKATDKLLNLGHRPSTLINLAISLEYGVGYICGAMFMYRFSISLIHNFTDLLISNSILVKHENNMAYLD